MNPTKENPLPVAAVAQKMSDWIARLGTVWVEGELTQWDVRGPNVYAKLKDLNENATLSLAIWRNVVAGLKDTFAQGDRVVVLVRPDYWVVGGSLSFIVQEITHMGLGELLERLERLRRLLQEEGLFDPEHKKPIPFLPKCIGLVTGRNSDAEKDVLKNARLRWPDVKFRTIHTAVQGEMAAYEVGEAVQTLDSDPEVDVIIIARGGGDFQHLLPFSDERLLRIVYAAETPVVSAIGHEADRPLLDEVVDLRASTPTDAAKRVVPDIVQEREELEDLSWRLRTRTRYLLAAAEEQLQALRWRPVLQYPDRMIAVYRDDFERWYERLRTAVQQKLGRAEQEYAGLVAQLRGLSPMQTLQRGYALVQTEESELVTDPAQLTAKQALTVTLYHGSFTARVEQAPVAAPLGARAAAATEHAKTSESVEPDIQESPQHKQNEHKEEK